LSRAVGRLCEQELNPTIVEFASKVYARAYGVNLSEAEPTGPYKSFDEFFTRRLRQGARHIDSSSEIVSPSDGDLVASGRISETGQGAARSSQIVVKGRPYDVAELTGHGPDRDYYAGGDFAVVYLHPRDYHRVHSPVDGMISMVRSLPGDLFPVNSIGERHIPGLFVRNQRVAVTIDSDKLGKVTVILVGATIVGRITIGVIGGRGTPVGEHQIHPAVPVVRGGELGMFHLGSTAVVLLPKGGTLTTRTGPVLLGESLVST
jgi:phosphatidylserine decarboxylase